jgi:hypothetical protein
LQVRLEMRVLLTLALGLSLASCATRVDEPLPEEEADGPRECWEDSECVVAREVSGCCAGCAGAFPRAIADESTCLVEEGADVPESCWDAGCGAESACSPVCLDPVDALCVRGRCVGLYDCDGDTTVPQGTFCGAE